MTAWDPRGSRAHACHGAAVDIPNQVVILTHRPTGCSSAWLERLVRDQEVAGSNPVTPTRLATTLPNDGNHKKVAEQQLLDELKPRLLSVPGSARPAS